MTATLRMGFWLAYVLGGRLKERVGDPGAELAEVSTPGDGHLARRVTIAAGETAVLWKWADLNDFEVVVLLISDSGYANIAVLADKPTSASDSTPLGTHESWRQFDLSCKIPFILNTDAALVNPVAADDNGDTAGLPTIFSDAGTVDGKVYKIAAKNPDDADDVTIEVWVLN